MNARPVPTVASVNTAVETLWPISGAASWDAPGLLIGDPGAEVGSVLLAVDAVDATITDAVNGGHDLLLTHHPLFLRGVHTLAGTTAKGAMTARLIRAGCALIAAHTNADIVRDGVSDVLAKRLDIEQVQPIVPGADSEIGTGRVGSLAEAEPLGEFTARLAGILPATAGGLRVAGDPGRPVRRIALCGGAGDSLLNEAAVLEADVYITSDLRHHPAQEAIETALLSGGPALVDISHWAAESLWLEVAALQLAEALPEVRFTVSTTVTDPWTYAVPTGRRSGARDPEEGE